MADLLSIRQTIESELKRYPRRELAEVEQRWKFTGLFGGHRDYLGLDESWPSSEALLGWLRNGGLLGATLALTGISFRHGQRQRRP